MTTRHIVFGDDRSPGADAAWGWINAQDWGGWAVEAITAVPHDYSRHAGALEEADAVIPARHALPAAGLASVLEETIIGDPRVVLLDHANDGLLIVGARGAGGLEGMLIGSATDWLMRSPPTPMVIARQADPVRSVLVCVDGSRHALAAVRAFAALPWASTTSCTVLGVADTGESPRPAVEEASAILRTAGAEVTEKVLELDGMAITLRPDMLILDEVKTLQPDLIVLGTQGRTGLALLWFGSVAGAVTHHTSANVLLAKAE